MEARSPAGLRAFHRCVLRLRAPSDRRTPARPACPRRRRCPTHHACIPSTSTFTSAPKSSLASSFTHPGASALAPNGGTLSTRRCAPGASSVLTAKTLLQRRTRCHAGKPLRAGTKHARPTASRCTRVGIRRTRDRTALPGRQAPGHFRPAPPRRQPGFRTRSPPARTRAPARACARAVSARLLRSRLLSARPFSSSDTTSRLTAGRRHPNSYGRVSRHHHLDPDLPT